MKKVLLSAVVFVAMTGFAMAGGKRPVHHATHHPVRHHHAVHHSAHHSVHHSAHRPGHH